MGKRGSRNRNSVQKKKAPSVLSSQKPDQNVSMLKNGSKDQKKSNFDQVISTLRFFMKGLTSTFRSRLLFSKDEYKLEFPQSLDLDSIKTEQVFSVLANELTEEILSLIEVHSKQLSEFLLESYQCVQSVSLLFEKIFNSASFADIAKLSFFCKIFKPAWDIDKSLSKNSLLSEIYKDLHGLSKDFKDHSLLPLENLMQMINGTASIKLFSRICIDLSTEGSASPVRNVDSEIEEFRNRLESCEKPLPRKKPQISQEWINTLRTQLRKSR